MICQLTFFIMWMTDTQGICLQKDCLEQPLSKFVSDHIFWFLDFGWLHAIRTDGGHSFGNPLSVFKMKIALSMSCHLYIIMRVMIWQRQVWAEQKSSLRNVRWQGRILRLRYLSIWALCAGSELALAFFCLLVVFCFMELLLYVQSLQDAASWKMLACYFYKTFMKYFNLGTIFKIKQKNGFKNFVCDRIHIIRGTTPLF